MATMHKIVWLDKPKASNYGSAHSYLSLLYEEAKVQDYLQKLREAPVSYFKAKDIFRASELSLLGVSNARVERDLRKIKDKTALSPILLVRDHVNIKLIIADGYHRMCAVYRFDENEPIPCKIV